MTKTKPAKAIPDRLERLDRELMKGEKDFDYVYAVRNGYRIKCCVMRVIRPELRKDFTATASVRGKVHRTYGHTPREAFFDLIRAIKWTLQQRNIKTFTLCFFKGTDDRPCRRCLDCQQHYS